MGLLGYVVRGILFAIMGWMILLLGAVICFAVPFMFSGQFRSSVLAALFIGFIACVYCFIPLMLANLPIYYFRNKSTPVYLLVSFLSLSTAAALSLILAHDRLPASAFTAEPTLAAYVALTILATTALAYFLRPSGK